MLPLRACWALGPGKKYASSPSGRFTQHSSVLEGLRSLAIKNLFNSLYKSGWAKLCCRKQLKYGPVAKDEERVFLAHGTYTQKVRCDSATGHRLMEHAQSQAWLVTRLREKRCDEHT